MNKTIGELEKENKITENNVENNNEEQITLDCSFTRTYKIIHLLDEYKLQDQIIHLLL